MTDTQTYYAAFKLLTADRSETQMHATVWYDDDADAQKLASILPKLQGWAHLLACNSVKVTRLVDLGTIRACALVLMNGSYGMERRTKELIDFGNEHSRGEALEKRCDFAFHASLGDPNARREDKREKYRENKRVFEANGRTRSEFAIGDLYVKNMRTKATLTVSYAGDYGDPAMHSVLL